MLSVYNGIYAPLSVLKRYHTYVPVTNKTHQSNEIETIKLLLNYVLTSYPISIDNRLHRLISQTVKSSKTRMASARYS